MFSHTKYRPHRPIQLVDRQWPDRMIETAPSWCSVDLRDGNQALINPMSVEQKQRLFSQLVAVGFKEIEVGFPAASKPDFDFVRSLIDEERIPSDVTIQVLVQAREALIAKTFEALVGVRKAIVHVYNSTSPTQRRKVFNEGKEGVVAIAEQGARWLKEYAARFPDTDWSFEYSPESFSATEPEYAVKVCNAVIDIWQPTREKPVIINLPATVEMTTPNVFADQVEYVCRHLKCREAVRVSVHTHNDRGCAVAAAELAVLAGADRVEGTLFGNGERTGNMDVVTMAMNLYSQGVDPRLDFSQVQEAVRCVEECTEIKLHPRHPYVGELVYTAFSGSHQDAIRKCLSVQSHSAPWDVAYLPIDPQDLGRSYQQVIQVNSQSGKGGAAYLVEQHYGFSLPRWLQIQFSEIVQKVTERDGGVVRPEALAALFAESYIEVQEPYQVRDYRVERNGDVDVLSAEIADRDARVQISGMGNGVISALQQAVRHAFGVSFEVLDYHEQSVTAGTSADAAAIVQLRINGEAYAGVAINSDVISASINAVLVAVNRSVAATVKAA